MKVAFAKAFGLHVVVVVVDGPVYELAGRDEEDVGELDTEKDESERDPPEGAAMTATLLEKSFAHAERNAVRGMLGRWGQHRFERGLALRRFLDGNHAERSLAPLGGHSLSTKSTSYTRLNWPSSRLPKVRLTPSARLPAPVGRAERRNSSPCWWACARRRARLG